MRWSSLTLREGLVLIEANFKTGSLRKKRPTFPDAATDFPPSLPSIALRHDIPGTSPEIPDQTSALVLVENLLHPSLFFWHFDNSCGSLLYTLDLRLQRVLVWWPHWLESGASPGTSPETGRASTSHWRPLWEGRPNSEVQGACWPWRR